MSAAIHARLEGASVVAIESGTLGGTCVNVGCVPSKTLLAAAHTRHSALTNRFSGVPPSSAGMVDLSALIEQKDDLVGMLRQTKYADIAAAYGFDILPGTATFTDAGTLLVDGRPVRAKSYLVATGAEPHVPAIPGLEQVDYLTSTTAMELTELPASLVVIGGGFVGLEQAQLFARLGVEVTVIGRLAPARRTGTVIRAPQGLPGRGGDQRHRRPRSHDHPARGPGPGDDPQREGRDR